MPPPWLELTTSEPFFRATRVSPPGTMRMRSRPVSTNGRRSTWRGATPSSTQVGQVESASVGCAMKFFGLRLELGAKRRDRGLVGFRPDQHAVAARAVHLLDHQLLQVLEHIGEMVALAAAPGRDVLEDRLLAEIELHDLGHVAVDRLVVGDAGADRVGERDVAGMVARHQAGHAERGIGAEGERIEEVVVDAAIDHVDALGPLGGAHEDELVLDEQVAPLDQLDAELVGQEGMLVIGRVVDAGREQHHGRIGVGGGRGDRFQGRQQLVRIVLDRRHAVAGEQLREQPQHDLPVLQHVGDAGGRAGIVLEHVEGLGIDADDVDAADMDIDVVRHLLAVHLRPEHRILEHQILRDDAGLENLAPPVDVLDVEVDGLDALLEPAAQAGPIRRPTGCAAARRTG